MVKVARYFLIAMIILLSIGMFSAVYGEESKKAVVVANDVNIRQEPKTDAGITATVNLGEYLDVLDNNEGWMKVKLSDASAGWMNSEFLVVLDTQIGTIDGNNLNMREQPNIKATIIKTLAAGTEVTIIDREQEWCYIMTNDDIKGWVHGDYIRMNTNYPSGKIMGTNVNVRLLASTDGKIITKLDKDSNVSIMNFENGWYKILSDNGNEGWVYKDYIMISSRNNDIPTSRSANRTSGSVKIVGFAKEFLGKPYKWGANGPNSFDCSGFTSYVYGHFGVDLPRTSSDQGKTGERVSMDELQIADLVFFDTEGGNNGIVTHAGIYIGDGQFIHASSGSKAKKVTISSLTDGYYKEKFVVGRRLF